MSRDASVTAYVFIGPTLTRKEVLEVFECECLPPAAHGDVFHATGRRPRALGIVDGYFDGSPAVWHKEIP